MNVYVKLKSAGKRRPVLNNIPYAIPDGIASLRQLIEAIVRQEVDEYNNRVDGHDNCTDGHDNRAAGHDNCTDGHDNRAAGHDNRVAEYLLVPFLTETEISDRGAAGKISIGHLYSDKKANLEKAIDIALQGFEDGLFRVMVGDIEATELDKPLDVRDGITLTFIRLTFLAGRLW